jgi:hypothetical protein
MILSDLGIQPGSICRAGEPMVSSGKGEGLLTDFEKGAW